MAANNIWLAAGSSSLAVAVLTQAFTIGRERLAHRADQRFSALHIALALESYASECAHVIAEKETFISSDGHHGQDWATIPSLPDWPAAIEWRRLGIRNTEKVFALRVEVDAAKAKISDQYDFDPPDGGDGSVIDDTIGIGLRALLLATDIRVKAKLAPIVASDWPLERYLTEWRDDRAEKEAAMACRSRSAPLGRPVGTSQHTMRIGQPWL